MDEKQFKKQSDKLEKLVHRAKEERQLLEEIKRDPERVLRGAGLSDEIIGDFLREEGFHTYVATECHWSCIRTHNCQLTVSFP
jgi:hypothetical protein